MFLKINMSVPKYNTEFLKELKQRIIKLSVNEYKEIFKMLKSDNCKYSENKNGIFINMNNLKPNIIEKINDYINYTKCQETNLQDVETMKKNLQNKFFKDNKEKTPNNTNVQVHNTV